MAAVQDSPASAVPPESTAAGGPPWPLTWQRVVGTVAGMLLGLVLVVALWGKMLDPERFAELVAHEGLDFLLPAGVVAAIGLGLEAVLGFALLVNLRHMRVLVPSAALVAFFVFLTGRTYYRHATGQHEDDGSCGCFGNLVQRSPAEAFWQDIFLLVPPLALAFLGRPPIPMPWQKLRWGITLGLSAIVLGFAWLAPGLPLDDMATRLAPGVAASTLCIGEEDGRICMDDVIPEIGEEGHVVLLAKLDDPAFLKHVPALNDYALEGYGPLLWIVTAATEEEVEVWKLGQQPSFEVLPCPPGVIRPLYRRLPRSFLSVDGTVTRTWESWPPLAELVAKAKAEEEAEYGDPGEGEDEADEPGEDGEAGDDGDVDPDEPGKER